MSGHFLQKSWVSQLSSRVDNFKWVKENTANFRCPICGDSSTKKQKARGYVYQIKANWAYKCHNCGASMSFKNFLKDNFRDMYEDMMKDAFKSKMGSDSVLDELPDTPKQKNTTPKAYQCGSKQIMDAVRADLLPDSHDGVIYLHSRKIPPKALNRLYVVENFAKWVRSLNVGYDWMNLPRDSRIIIPIWSEDGMALVGCQARAIYETSLRYVTLKFDTTSSKIFGREALNKSTPSFVLEGPIDSFFIPNSVALCGGDVVDSNLGFLDKDKTIVVLDNEPRNADTISRMHKAVELGFRVCVWKAMPSRYKDINAMVLGGFTPNQIIKQIQEHSFSGLGAKLQIASWSKT